MPQILKPATRHHIEQATREAIAEHGYGGASIASIAKRAGVSTGNVYRYFPSKPALFAAAVPMRLVDELNAILDARVDALAALPDMASLDADAAAEQERFLAFLLAHRLEVVILLDRAEGTVHAGFGARFVDRLVQRAQHAIESRRGEPLAGPSLFLLHQLFEQTRRTLAALLFAHDEPATLRTVFAQFWTFQLAGLSALTTELSR